MKLNQLFLCCESKVSCRVSNFLFFSLSVIYQQKYSILIGVYSQFVKILRDDKYDMIIIVTIVIHWGKTTLISD